MSAVTPEMVEAGARALSPYVFTDGPLRIGCDGPWHYEAHGIHSTCPSCGSNRFAGRQFLFDARAKAQDGARHRAAAVLHAALAVDGH